MSPERLAEKIASTLYTLLYSSLSAYNIHIAISATGWRQIFFITMSIFTAVCANHYGTIMLKGDR